MRIMVTLMAVVTLTDYKGSCILCIEGKIAHDLKNHFPVIQDKMYLGDWT